MSTIAFLFKLPFILLMVILSLISVYSLAMVRHYRRLSVLPRVPEPFYSLNKMMMQFPIFAHALDRYESDVTLIYNSASYAKLYVTCYGVVIPAVSIITVISSFLYVSPWYFSILISTYGLIIPYLFVTNRIRDKTRNFRSDCLKLYEGAERGFSSSLPVATVFEEISRSSSDIVKRIAIGFLEEHSISSDNAYSYLAETIGDKYAIDFAKIVKHYEETGVDPCKAIKRTVKFARRQYNLNKISVNVNRALKRLAIVLFGIALICAGAAVLIANILEVSNTAPWLTYVAVVGILTIYVITQLNDRARG